MSKIIFLLVILCVSNYVMSQSTPSTNGGIQPAVAAIQNFIQAFLTVVQGWSQSAQSISNTFATIIQIVENLITNLQQVIASFLFPGGGTSPVGKRAVPEWPNLARM